MRGRMVNCRLFRLFHVPCSHVAYAPLACPLLALSRIALGVARNSVERHPAPWRNGVILWKHARQVARTSAVSAVSLERRLLGNCWFPFYARLDRLSLYGPRSEEAIPAIGADDVQDVRVELIFARGSRERKKRKA